MFTSTVFVQTIKRLALLLLAIATITFSNTLNAQQNYQPGFIITNDNDTIRGQIDYQNWVINPKSIDFIGTDRREISFNSLDISGFQVADEFYLSAVVQIETSPYLVNELNDVAQFRFDQKFVFLQAQILGEKSLYHLKDETAKDHFYIVVGNELQLLRYKRYLSGRLAIENKTYQGQLANYLSDCDKVDGWVKNTPYNKRYLSELFEKYARCKGTELEFTKEVEKLKSRFGVYAGLSMTNLTFNSIAFEPLDFMDLTTSSDLTFGFSAEIFIARNLERWSIQNELAYSSYTVSGGVTINNTTNFSVITYTADLGFSYIKMNNMLRYNHNMKLLTFFAGIGFSNGFAISELNEMDREITLFNNTRLVEEEAVLNARKYEQGLLFGFGIRRDRYSMELRFERGNGVASGSALSSDANRTFFIASYRL